jgi:hypothetical protein
MVASKQSPDDALVWTGASEVLVLTGAGDVLVELDEVLVELDEVLVELDRLRVLVLEVDNDTREDDELVLLDTDILEDVEEDLFPLPLLPLPLPLPLLPLFPLPLLPLPLPLPLPLLPLSFLATGLAAAHMLKRAAAKRIGLTMAVCGVSGNYEKVMRKKQTGAGANCSNLSVQAVHFVTSEAYTILPACPDLYHGFGLPSRTAFC